MEDSNKKLNDGLGYISKKQAIKICNISYGVFDRICDSLNIHPTIIGNSNQKRKYFSQEQIDQLCQFRKENKSISHYLYGNPEEDRKNQIKQEIKEKGMLTKNGVSNKLGIPHKTIDRVARELNIEPTYLEGHYYYSKEQTISMENFKKEHEPLGQYFYKKTCMEKYGVENVFLRKDVKEKAIKNSHTKECIEKQIETKIKNFGSYDNYREYMSTQLKTYAEENPDKIKESIEKTKKTIIERYGVNNISKLDWIKEKKKDSTLKTLGVENPLQSRELKEQGMLNKYGVDNPAKDPTLLQKRIETTLNKTDEERKLSYEKRQDSLKEKYGDNYRQILTEKGIETNKRNHNGVFYLGTKEQLKQASDTYYAKTGYKHPSQNPNTRKNHRTNYYLDDYEFDSSWELAYYIYLRDNSIPFEFHTMRIPYEYDNKVHYYMPDFKVYDRIVEIKGDHLLKDNVFEKESRANAKYKCMIDNNVLILTLDDIKPYISYVKNKYGNNYLKECRNKKD